MLKKKNNLQFETPKALLRLSGSIALKKKTIIRNGSPSMQEKLKNLKDKISHKKSMSSTQSRFETPTGKINSQTLNFLSKKNQSPKPFACDSIQEKNSVFFEYLKENKLENYCEILKEHNIQNQSQLHMLSEPEIDKIKQLPLGYRIKLKRLIRDKYNIKEKTPVVDSNVQNIVANRKNTNKYQKLDYQNEEDNIIYEENYNEKNEQQQTIMINKITNFFMWENNKEEKEKYTKKNNQKGAIKTQNRKYCWECLSEVSNQNLDGGKRQKQFCSSNCLDSFNKRIIVDEQMIKNNEAAENQSSIQHGIYFNGQSASYTQDFIDLSVM